MRDPYKVMDGAVQAALRRGAGLAVDANVPTGSQPGSDAGSAHDPENGQFTSGQHNAAASEHRKKGQEHHEKGEHEAAMAHRAASNAHAYAAIGGGSAENAHMRTKIANRASEEAIAKRK